jgi:amino acid transporter
VDPNLPAGKVPFDVLTDFAVFGAVVFETMAVAALFRFRARGAGLPPVYRCWGYPWVPLVYVVAMAAVATNMLGTPTQRGEAVIGLGLMAIGAIVYALFGRRG